MIRVPNWVGDAVMAIPALREMRRIFSDSHITLVARPWVAGLFDGEGLADDLIPALDRRGLARTISGFIAETRALGRERFDLAVLLQNAFGAALTARAAGVKRVAGYPTDHRGPLLDYVIDLEPDHKTTHQVFYYLNIAARLEKRFKGECRVDPPKAQPSLHVSPEEKERARRLLASCGVAVDSPRDESSRILALNPGATNSRAKRWLPDRFAETADRLATHHGFRTIILGSAGDAEVAEKVARLMRSRPALLAGRTTIAELKAVLACSRLVISNDTGTAHVSAALAVPTVVVFGPTEHVSTRPLSDAALVVRREVECSPCMLRDCPIDHRCMTRVEVDEVYRAAERLLTQSFNTCS
ncbi:MAG TPA: lipopolysaccharide heptosyltransferase II [Blastocatellia bacterium]|nr:lipopolysaccharide heptosyltransferase II [Blastocatellia bacterium]